MTNQHERLREWLNEYPSATSDAAVMYRGLLAEYDAALARIAELEQQLGDAAATLRAMNEEFVLAGYPGGDRAVTLANIRAALAKAPPAA